MSAPGLGLGLVGGAICYVVLCLWIDGVTPLSLSHTRAESVRQFNKNVGYPGGAP